MGAALRSDETGNVDLPDTPPIQAAEEALNVFELERVAREKLPPAHYAQIATGAGAGRTLLRNRAIFNAFGIQARRMVGVAKIDTGLRLWDTSMNHPILLSPVGSHRMAHPDGEVATARGAATRNATMILSTMTSTGVEEVARARTSPIWYQLYPNSEWQVNVALVRRAEAAGCPVIVCTVDGLGARREIFERFLRTDQRDCSTCHSVDKQHMETRNPFVGKPMFAGIDVANLRMLGTSIDWAFIRKLRELTRAKLVIKGILAAEDAQLAVAAGADADGIIVSNHGGRVFDTGVSTLEVLPEVVKAVARKVPVLIDSGFRRGTDVFTALALGASAVCIGRPYMWGLAAFGAQGVAVAHKLMSTEFEQAMRHAGALTLADIDQRRIRSVAP